MSKLSEKIKAAGVVGAGGAGFPTHIKLSASPQYIIINAAECEPLVYVDQLLVEKYAAVLAKTLEQIVNETGAQQGIFAIKKKYVKAIENLSAFLNNPKISLHLLEDVYPMGDEQVLVYEVLQKIVPQGGIPLNVDAVVLNVETLLNISNALQNIPVTDTYLTIGGGIPTAQTFKLPIGITIREAVSLAGNFDENEYAIIDGGPMMGCLVCNWDAPIIKTTKALLLFKNEHPLILNRKRYRNGVSKKTLSACCSCTTCTESCPRYLLGHSIQPHKIMTALWSGNSTEHPIFNNALLCSECGVCESYACTMDLSPRRVNMEIKEQLRQRGEKLPTSTISPEPNPLRESRLIPSERLKARLGISDFHHSPVLIEDNNKNFSSVKIKLKQHLGTPAEPIVKIGDSVKRGTLIATAPENTISANIHSSIDGEVSEVNKDFIEIRKH